MAGFIRVPNAIFDYKLTPKAFALFLYFLSKVSCIQTVSAFYEALAIATGQSVSGIRAAVGELCDSRLITMRHRYNARGYVANRYYISVPKAHSRSWFAVDRALIADGGSITPSDLVVYCYIRKCMDSKKKEAFPSLSGIAAGTGMSRRRVATAVSFLRDHSYMNRIRRYRRHTLAFKQNRYIHFRFTTTVKADKKRMSLAHAAPSNAKRNTEEHPKLQCHDIPIRGKSQWVSGNVYICMCLRFFAKARYTPARLRRTLLLFVGWCKIKQTGIRPTLLPIRKKDFRYVFSSYYVTYARVYAKKQFRKLGKYDIFCDIMSVAILCARRVQRRRKRIFRRMLKMSMDKGMVESVVEKNPLFVENCEEGEATLYSALDQWTASLYGSGLRPSTQRCYRDAVRRLKTVMENISLNDVTPTLFQKALLELAEKGYAASTLKHIRITLGEAFDYHNKPELAMHSPRKPLSIPKQAPSRLVEPLTVDEQRQIEQACNEDEYGILFLFLLYSGLRCSELCSLKWEDYNKKQRQIRVTKSKTKAGQRLIPLTSICELIISIQPHDNEYIFNSERTGKPITYSILRKAYARLQRKTGIKDFTNHVCRHSFATRMIESNVDPKALSDILGHASVSFTLDRYVKSQPEYLRKQINLLGNPQLLPGKKIG